MRLIDSHSHINFPAYDADRDDTVARAADAGIGMLAVGTMRATSLSAVACAARYPNIWATVGLHPTRVHPSYDDPQEGQGPDAERFDSTWYEALARSSPRVVAIGECGLDYFHVPEGVQIDAFRAEQQRVFREHCALALTVGKPLMVHCRDAHDDLAAILAEFSAASTPLRGNIHCFTGTRAEAERYLELGFYVSFTGIVTYPARKSDRDAGRDTLADVARVVPLDRMLVETDAPYLAPIPHRGERNEPALVQHVAEFIAAVKGMTPDEVAAQTTENARKLFGL